MKIATLTFNPAIDHTVWVDHFRMNAINRSRGMLVEPSGKGVNVASLLADYGFEVAVTGWLGRENADNFERFFAEKLIDDHFLRIPGRTRMNIKVVDEASQEATDINAPGLPVPADAVESLGVIIERLAVTCSWFVCSGSLPPQAPENSYAILVAKLKRCGVRVLLDTSGEALRAGILAVPDVVKPNLEELQQLVGHALNNEEEIVQAAHELLELGIELVVVSMGARGALFVTQDVTLMAVPPPVQVKRTAGAGDALVAGLVAGLAQGLNVPAIARLATAFALGLVTRSDVRLPPPEELKAYEEQVSIVPRLLY